MKKLFTLALSLVLCLSLSVGAVATDSVETPAPAVPEARPSEDDDIRRSEIAATVLRASGYIIPEGATIEIVDWYDLNDKSAGVTKVSRSSDYEVRFGITEPELEGETVYVIHELEDAYGNKNYEVIDKKVENGVISIHVKSLSLFTIVAVKDSKDSYVDLKKVTPKPTPSTPSEPEGGTPPKAPQTGEYKLSITD